MIPTTQLKEILEKAGKMTPGKREVIRFDSDGGAIDYQVETEMRSGLEHVIIASFCEFGNPKDNKGDAELCAALDKETVESLIRELLAWRECGKPALEASTGTYSDIFVERARADLVHEALRRIEEASK